ncbi:MAG: hypothetical protein J6Y47_00505, partial [Bacteroidales bacterium]|nr:hypothetical protein [Bacteroidales bacterium]
MGNNKSETKGTRIILSIGFLFAVGAICFFIFKIPDFWPQMLAIIASAFLGAGATAWITNTLLNNKQKTEEAKEKNIKVYENKINVYSEIVQKLWEILEENDEEMINKIEGLRSYIFQKVVLYLPDEGVANLNNIFSEVGNLYDEDELEKDNETEGNDTDDGKIQKLQRIFSKITFILKKDLEEKNLEKQERTLKTDLKKIKEWINNIIKRIKQYFVFKENSKKEEKTSGDTTKYVSLYNNLSLKKRKETVLQFDMVKSNTNNVEKNEDAYNFWHFIMFDNEQIDEAFKNNKYELSLIEYGETWRTNRVKQVKQGDIVFLFRRGGYGY